MIHPVITSVVSHFAAPCAGGSFLGFPKWYKYLNGQVIPEGQAYAGTCVPRLEHIADIWLVVAAVVELLIRIGGILAVVFVIYGGVQYIVSQGDPGKTNQARQTIINALVGLAIAIGATVVVTFIAGRFREG